MLVRPHAAHLAAGALALTLVAPGCASTGSAPRPFPMPVAARPTPEPSSGSGDAPAERATAAGERRTRLLVDTALRLQGIRYRDGGSDPDGFDCSGFTQYVFGMSGTRLPREVRDQFTVGAPVPRGEQQPGDLMFFTTTAAGASHVGIVVDGDEFVHAPSMRGVVRVERLSLPYWSSRLIGIRRVRLD